MEYTSIMFTKSEKWPLALIKYTEEYEKYLEQIKRFNGSLADSIEKCPKMYSELSEHQSYMIFLGEYYCVGGINIETSFDERNLELEIHFDEKYICLSEEINEITERIVDGLSRNFPDKEKIEMRLLNDVDLSRYYKYKYIKKVYDEKLTTYTCKNRYYQSQNIESSREKDKTQNTSKKKMLQKQI